ncbi:hypothetical protein BRD13_01865 [Halobacteriales archaeon SW_5_70_135]|nr:MAG: hypothetical protein BRD13_01865 [Halobacteriales archaeon SW_5_70_135]
MHDASTRRRLLAGLAGAGAVTHLTTANGDPPQPASVTVGFPDGDAVDEGALTGSLGTAASDPSFVRDDTTVRVSDTDTWADLSAYDCGGWGGDD